jgi:glycosyltransferase involved in cell wall biosynthesis
MRIGMFSNAYRPSLSGVVRSVDLYSHGLRQAGHFVSIFAPDNRNYEDAEPFIFRYPALPLPSGTDYTLPVLVAPQIDWLVPRLKLDIIHTHHPFVVGNAALNFSRSLGIPLVMTFHTMYHEYTNYLGLDVSLARQIIKRVVSSYVRKADCVIVPSTSAQETLFNEYNIDLPAVVLPTPVDLAQFPARSRPPFSNPDLIQAVFVGRIDRNKNLDFLLRAFGRAWRRDPRLRLRLIGDGPDFEKFLDLAASLGLERVVTFVGPAPFEQVPRELAVADLFLFASVIETQGLVALEAMAAGLPLALVDCPPLRDCLHPGLDSLVVEEDETAFAEAILLLARDPGRAQAMGAAARRTAEQFSIEALTARLIAIYQETIAAYQRRRRL